MIGMHRVWIDVASDETKAATHALLAEASASDVRIALLLDRAFVPADEWCRFAASTPGVPLYGGKYAGDGVEQASPWLCTVPEQGASPGPWLDALFRLCAGRPMLTLLQTRLPLQPLRLHLQQRLEASVAGETFVVRYADTRCLPQLFEVLDPAQRAAFLASIDGWRYVDRAGALQSLPKQSADAAAALPFVLSPDQQQALQTAALPDTLIAYLRERQDVFGHLCGWPSAIHRCVHAVLGGLAETPQISANAYRQVLVALEAEGLLSAAEATQDA
ncbi:DUF4123 domain-containing protein [Xanthomonas oryzae]|nr:DUF4123 domain-containing protein [Xanthomonas oryzae]